MKFLFMTIILNRASITHTQFHNIMARYLGTEWKMAFPTYANERRIPILHARPVHIQTEPTPNELYEMNLTCEILFIHLLSTWQTMKFDFQLKLTTWVVRLMWWIKELKVEVMEVVEKALGNDNII